MNDQLSPLLGFKEQFAFIPTVINKEVLLEHKNVIVCGMGGSAISVSLLKILFPSLLITLHNSYGLPATFDKENTLFILNSYSGSTEEVLDTFERAKKEGCTMASLSCGGTLIEKAKELGGAYVELPQSTLEPRFSIGYQIIGLLALMGEDKKIEELRKRVELLDIAKVDAQGKELAEKFEGKYPVIYASLNFYPVAYLIKAAINEGAKIPSFVNIIPEANHNESQSFVTDDTHNESHAFGFFFITSTFDHVRILKRFSVMSTLYGEKGFVASTLQSNHTDTLNVFEVVLTGYFMATYMAIARNVDPYKTPLVAEFKKRLAL